MLKQLIPIYTLITLLLTALSLQVWGQGYTSTSFSKIMKVGKYGRNDELSFNFKNLNSNVYYYQNADLRRLIFRAETKGDKAALQKVLEEYVNNFGIQNFKKDIDLVWRLGELYAASNQSSKAIAMYRLALKHHRGTLRKVDGLLTLEEGKVRQYYDSLTKPRKDYFVPIKYYYELVDYRKNIDTLRPPQSMDLRMGDEPNSPKADYGPFLATSSDTLFFTSKRKRKKNGRGANEDVYMSIDPAGYFYEVEPLRSLNTEYNEGSICMSKDKKTLIFSRCDAPTGMGNCDLYSAQWIAKDKTWANIRNLGPNVNTSAWESQPCLSPTGDTLYFASDRLDGFGLSDIWFSVKQRTGEWSLAKNLGPVINTSSNEVSPFYHPTYSVLYYSSDNKLLNFGNFDIYKSYQDGGIFLEPKNIGPLVNGAGSEYYFTIDGKNKNLYYARSEASDLDNLDLYSFPLPMEAQPQATTQFSGTLTDTTGKPFQGIVSVIDLDQGVEVAPKFLRPDGSFDFDLIKDRNYLLIIQGDDFFRIQEKFFLKGDTLIQKTTQSLRNAKISFSSLEFKENSAEILTAMEPDLRNVLNFLVDNPRFSMKISGHTDGKGNPTANQKLSQGRAESIKKWLVDQGSVKEERIEAIGYGSSKPIIHNEMTDADRKINRRVEFEIITPKE